MLPMYVGSKYKMLTKHKSLTKGEKQLCLMILPKVIHEDVLLVLAYQNSLSEKNKNSIGSVCQNIRKK